MKNLSFITNKVLAGLILLFISSSLLAQDWQTNFEKAKALLDIMSEDFKVLGEYKSARMT